MSLRRDWIRRLAMISNIDASYFRIRVDSQHAKLPEKKEKRDATNNRPAENCENSDELPGELVKWREKTVAVFPI